MEELIPLPSTFVTATRTSTYDKVGKYSATTLIKAPQVRVLGMRYADLLIQDSADLEDEDDEDILPMFGTAMHLYLEQFADPTRNLVEHRMVEVVEGVEVSGKPDLLDTLTHVLYDYKVTTTWVARAGKPKRDWVYQLNIYAWFLRRAGVAVERAAVLAFFRDWSKSRVAMYPDYPRRPRMLFEIPLWDHYAVEELIRQRVLLHETTEHLADHNLPECTPEDKWQSPDIWAVTKPGYKRPYRKLESQLEAERLLESLGPGYQIEFRPGEPKRCHEYCEVRDFCQQYRREQPERQPAEAKAWGAGPDAD